MSETNINWVLVETVEVSGKKFFYWNHLVDALNLHDFSPRYYKCTEVLIRDHPNKKFISEADMIKLCKEKLGELDILPNTIVPKK